MHKNRVAISIFVVATLLALGIFRFGILPKILALRGPRTLNTSAVIRQVQTLTDVVTIKYVIEKVVVFEDVKWYGESRVLLVAHGIVKAGINLGTLTEKDIKQEGTKLIVILPPARITDVYLDDQRTEVVERTTGVLRRFDKDLEQSARRIAVDDIGRAARRDGILKEADDRARTMLTAFCKQLGYTEVEFRSK